MGGCLTKTTTNKSNTKDIEDRRKNYDQNAMDDVERCEV